MHLGRLRRAIGRRAGRGGKRVLRRNEDDAAAEALILHDQITPSCGQEISGREDRDIAVPKLERSVFERSRGGDAGVGDDDVQPDKGEDRFVKRGVDLALVRHVDMDSRDTSLPNRLPKSATDASRLWASMSASTTQAPSPISRAAIACPMPPAPPVTSATRPASDFGFGMRWSLASSSNQYSILNASCSESPT